MLIIGFDWASDKHDVCILCPDGSVLYKGEVEHSAKGFEKLQQKIASLEPREDEVHVALEQHDGALLAWLLASGYAVYGINPKSADRARDVFHPSGEKDDKRDARMIADLLRNNLSYYKPMYAQSDKTLNLRALARLRVSLVQEKAALKQKIRGRLAEWCPDMSKLCSDLERVWQRELLHRWPLHEDLTKAEDKDMKAFLSSKRLRAETKEAIQCVRASRATHVPRGRKTALRMEMKFLLDKLDTIIDQIKQVDEELESAYKSHSNHAVFNTLPIKATTSLAMIAGAFGDHRSNPPSWSRYASWWGVGPVTVASGKKKLVKRRRGCDWQVHQALLDFSFSTVFNASGCWASDYYKRKLEEGHSHNGILRALSSRWVKILWTIWHKGIAYNEMFHREQIMLAKTKIRKSG